MKICSGSIHEFGIPCYIVAAVDFTNIPTITINEVVIYRSEAMPFFSLFTRIGILYFSEMFFKNLDGIEVDISNSLFSVCSCSDRVHLSR
jgi:hypothetical protein